MKQILINCAEVKFIRESPLIRVELTGEIGDRKFLLTTQSRGGALWTIPTDDFETENNDAIRLAYMNFSMSETIADDMESLNASELLERIPEFKGQVIAAASSANAVHW